MSNNELIKKVVKGVDSIMGKGWLSHALNKDYRKNSCGSLDMEIYEKTFYDGTTHSFIIARDCRQNTRIPNFRNVSEANPGRMVEYCIGKKNEPPKRIGLQFINNQQPYLFALNFVLDSINKIELKYLEKEML